MIRIIAECGVNWTNLEEAHELIRCAAEAHVYACKFQLFNESVIADSIHKEELQDKILDKQEAYELVQHGKELGMPLLFTPMYLEAVQWCEEFDVPFIKIRHADRSNEELISKALLMNKPILLSANVYDYPTLAASVWNNLMWKIKLLYCISEYPARMEDYMISGQNLLFFNGMSDHTKDLKLLDYANDLTLMEYFEKHVMLDNPKSAPLEADWSVKIGELKEWIERHGNV